MSVARLDTVVPRRALRHDPGELQGTVISLLRDLRQRGPLAGHRLAVDLRDGTRVAHAAGDVERLVRAPVPADDAPVERAVVVQRVTDARVRVAAIEVARPPEARVPRRLDVVGSCRGHVRVEVRGT